MESLFGLDFLISVGWPVLVLLIIGLFLAVVMPWLKRQAKKTETDIDDGIFNVIEVWLKLIASKFLKRGGGVGIIIFMAILPVLLSGCIFSGYGVDYDSGVWLRITSEGNDKKLVVETTLNESDKGAVETITQAVMDALK